MSKSDGATTRGADQSARSDSSSQRSCSAASHWSAAARLLAACEERRAAAETPRPHSPVGSSRAQDIAYLDEIADTILPTTKTPGAKAARTGAFMALMVTDTLQPGRQKIFRDGMRDARRREQEGEQRRRSWRRRRSSASRCSSARPRAEAHMDARDAARRDAKRTAAGADDRRGGARPKATAYLPDQRKETAPAPKSVPRQRSRRTRRHTTSA